MAKAKRLQLFRNSVAFESKDLAIEGLQSQLSTLLVGEPAIAWYTESGETKVILGISAGNGKYQIFDTEAIPSEVQEIIDRLDGEEGVEGSVKNLIKTAIEKLDKTDSAVTNQYVSAVSENNGIITVSRKQLVGTSDKVLAFSDSGITSTIKLKKVTDGLQGTEKEKYQLVGIGDAVLGDVITINKDQSFKNAELLEKGTGEPPLEEDTLRLTYVDGSGKDVNVDIPLDKFIDTAATIKLTGYTIATGTNTELQLSTQDSINTAFGKVEKAILDNEEVCSKAFDVVATAVGLNRDGMTYEAPSGSTYLTGATSVKDADTKLDAAIKAVNDKVTSAVGKNYLTSVTAGNGITVGAKTSNTQTITAKAVASDPVIEVTSNGIGTKSNAVWDCGTY